MYSSGSVCLQKPAYTARPLQGDQVSVLSHICVFLCTEMNDRVEKTGSIARKHTEAILVLDLLFTARCHFRRQFPKAGRGEFLLRVRARAALHLHGGCKAGSSGRRRIVLKVLLTVVSIVFGGSSGSLHDCRDLLPDACHHGRLSSLLICEPPVAHVNKVPKSMRKPHCNEHCIQYLHLRSFEQLTIA